MTAARPTADWAKRVAGWCAVLSIPLSLMSAVLAMSSGNWGGNGKVPSYAWYALWPSVVCIGTGLVVFIAGLQRRVCWRALVGLLCVVSGAVQLALAVLALLMFSIQ